jgi:hypothetical protein
MEPSCPVKASTGIALPFSIKFSYVFNARTLQNVKNLYSVHSISFHHAWSRHNIKLVSPPLASTPSPKYNRQLALPDATILLMMITPKCRIMKLYGRCRLVLYSALNMWNMELQQAVVAATFDFKLYSVWHALPY